MCYICLKCGNLQIIKLWNIYVSPESIFFYEKDIESFSSEKRRGSSCDMRGLCFVFMFCVCLWILADITLLSMFLVKL
uniref:Uncharacterized protein n=1 Tax=Arundo donax TaxID=35708 RepID=A0A0A9DC93_ARUDO